MKTWSPWSFAIPPLCPVRRRLEAHESWCAHSSNTLASCFESPYRSTFPARPGKDRRCYQLVFMELEECRDSRDRPGGLSYFPGILANCWRVQKRLGLSSSDLVKACRASASLFSLRRSEEHTSELQSLRHPVRRLLLEKNNSIAVWPREEHGRDARAAPRCRGGRA